jgi:hypothetical protein
LAKVDVNKEIDWHGARQAAYGVVVKDWDSPGPRATKVWAGNRLVADADESAGAWPKPVYPEPPCGWDERDALV